METTKMKRVLMGLCAAALLTSLVVAQRRNHTPKSSTADTLENVKRAIDKGNAQWSEGWAKGDATMVAAIFAGDGVQLLGSGVLVKGREQIATRLKTAMQGLDPGVKVTVTTTHVWLDGDTAYETGKYKYEYTAKGKAGTDEGRYVTCWKRQTDGSWKLSMDMGVPQ
jgi:uncharacterized protein (TIGR02246 family)